MSLDKMEKIVSLCKRRGFIFPNSEIYGGLNAIWDYGPLGVEIKRNIKEIWWENTVKNRANIVGLDTSILMHPTTWKTSGHLDHFSDPLRECKTCHERLRADHLENDNCPSCGGELTETRSFNTMFKTFIGAVEDSANEIYIRPETAQGIYVNFTNVQNTTRMKIPFGIAQIGKAFRNEITTGNFIFRCREFEQMELEFFTEPDSAEKWFNYWIQERFNWYLTLGINKSDLRIRPHENTELAHYSKGCSDIEYNFPWGWGELEGIANRGDFDLKAHSTGSGKDLTYFDELINKHYHPWVIEPSCGVDRVILTCLLNAYQEELDEKNNERIILKLDPKLSPIKVAILPLSKKPPLIEISKKIYSEISKDFNCQYDDTQSIGKRYRRQDEIGTPFCITIDFDTINDNKVTIRHRDTMKQERISLNSIQKFLDKIY
tara:strand:- start:371 stop:1669 length:1299 start_codon:yes stop_codon:yes gene_type:complete